MRCTVENIAKQIGYSVATVSRVLNNSAAVSPQARSAVLEAIQKSGGVPRVLGRRNRRRQPVVAEPKATASSLVEILVIRRGPMELVEARADGAFQIGPLGSLTVDRLFSPANRFANSFYRHIVDGAVDELRRFNRRAVLQAADSLVGQRLLNEINDASNTGLILIGDYGDDVEPFLAKCRCPVVSLVTWDHAGWPDYVGIDNLQGISQAFDHLRALGHTRIGYIAGTPHSAVFRQRHAAYRFKLAEAGLPWRAEHVAEGSNSIGVIEAQVEVMLRQSDHPTAVMCSYDGAALAVHRAAGRLGISVPHQLSVVGFDDEEIAQLFTPPLTTVRVPTHEMGRRAVQMLLMRPEHHTNDRGEGCSLRVMPSLIVRESTAVPYSG